MGGVDRQDQNIGLYRIGIRGKKWYWCLICQVLDMCVQNSWQLHRTDGGTLDQLAFRRNIAVSILQKHAKQTPKQRSRPSQLENLGARYDQVGHYVASQGKQTRCRLCHKKVSTKCVKCDVALHIDCFIPYHTQ